MLYRKIDKKSYQLALENKSQIDALSCINFTTNLAPFWDGLAPILVPSWRQMAQKIKSKIHQKTDAMLYRFLVDFCSILDPN